MTETSIKLYFCNAFNFVFNLFPDRYGCDGFCHGDESRKRTLVKSFYNSRNAQAFGPIYTSDAVIFPQGSPPIQGRTAIVQFWFEIFKKQFRSPTLEIIDLREEGRLAYQTCRWSLLKPTGNGAVRKLAVIRCVLLNASRMGAGSSKYKCQTATTHYP